MHLVKKSTLKLNLKSMFDLFLEDILTSSDRYKIYLLKYHASELDEKIDLLNNLKINMTQNHNYLIHAHFFFVSK
jgi:hypothetical protein